MVRFICDSCNGERLQGIICHGHRISFRNEQFVCTDCSDRQLSDREIEECVPKCCHRPMRPIGGG